VTADGKENSIKNAGTDGKENIRSGFLYALAASGSSLTLRKLG
jgi:hypothetical protein